MTPKLYGTDHSPTTRSVYMAAKYMGISLDYIETNLLKYENLKPEFVKLNPQHTLPTLEDGGQVIWDSHAINVYLTTKYGKDESLYPKDPFKRAVIDQRLYFDTGVLFPLVRRIVRPMLDKGVKTITDDLVAEVNAGYEFVEKFLGGNKWITGDNLTLADFSILTSVTSLDLFVPINASKYSNTIAWIKRAEQHSWYEVNQKGYEEFKALAQQLLKKFP